MLQHNLLPDATKEHAKPSSSGTAPVPRRVQDAAKEQQDTSRQPLQCRSLGVRQSHGTRERRGQAALDARRHDVAALRVAAAPVLQQADHSHQARHPEQPKNHDEYLRSDDALDSHVALARVHRWFPGVLPTADVPVGSVIASAEGRCNH